MAEQRKMNKFIVIFVGIIVVFIVFIFLKGNTEKYTAINTLPSKESKDKPEDGDTQADTIRALQAYAKEAVEKAKRLNEKTITQSQQVEENKNTVYSLERKNQKNKEELKETKEYTKTLESKLKELNNKLDVIINPAI